MKARIALLAAAATLAVAGVEYELNGAARMLPDDPRCDLRPGLKMSCRVKFAAHPSDVGQMSFLQKGHPNSPG